MRYFISYSIDCVVICKSLFDLKGMTFGQEGMKQWVWSRLNADTDVKKELRAMLREDKRGLLINLNINKFTDLSIHGWMTIEESKVVIAELDKQLA
jgi:hypothetical protein